MSDFLKALAANAEALRATMNESYSQETEAGLLGAGIARAEYESLAVADIASAVATAKKNDENRKGAYVALGKAIVAAMLMQRAHTVDALIANAKVAAFDELHRLGLTGDTLDKRRKAIEKGMSRAKTAASERVTGKTKDGEEISVASIASADDFTSTETESDRRGREKAKAKGTGERVGDKKAQAERQVLGAFKAMRAAREGTAGRKNASEALEMALAAWAVFITEDAPAA